MTRTRRRSLSLLFGFLLLSLLGCQSEEQRKQALSEQKMKKTLPRTWASVHVEAEDEESLRRTWRLTFTADRRFTRTVREVGGRGFEVSTGCYRLLEGKGQVQLIPLDETKLARLEELDIDDLKGPSSERYFVFLEKSKPKQTISLSKPGLKIRLVEGLAPRVPKGLAKEDKAEVEEPVPGENEEPTPGSEEEEAEDVEETEEIAEEEAPPSTGESNPVNRFVGEWVMKGGSRTPRYQGGEVRFSFQENERYSFVGIPKDGEAEHESGYYQVSERQGKLYLADSLAEAVRLKEEDGPESYKFYFDGERLVLFGKRGLQAVRFTLRKAEGEE